MAINFSGLFYIIFLLISYQRSENACVSGENLVSKAQFEHVLSLDSLMPEPTCQSTRPSGVGLEYGLALIPSRGPCSPFIVGDSLAATTPKRKLTGPQGKDPGVDITDDRDKYQYLVPIGIGTPRRDLALIMDTGSDITWAHCGFCAVKSCNFKPLGLVGPSASPTFSWFCDPPATYFSPSCEYSISYLDKSASIGYKARDVLNVGTSYRLQGFIFGCGQQITGDFGNADGVLGLKMDGEYTFLSQTSLTLGRIFCYCIPPTDSSHGYLYFGDGARKNCQTQTSTPLIDKKDYLVNLLGLSVGNQTLRFAELSSPTQTIIDTGTYLTRLPQQVYRMLRDKFQEYMSKYPVASSQDLAMDTCYHVKDNKNVTLPLIVLHFDQADVTLDPAGIVSQESNSRICLAFAANNLRPDTNILGSMQMKKLDILFDVNARTVSFGRGRCGT